MRKNKIFLILVTFFVLNSAISAQPAILETINGKVEANRNGEWVLLQEGEQIFQGDVLSTGFNSEVKLTFSGSSLILQSLTKVIFEELYAVPDSVGINLKLENGVLLANLFVPENCNLNFNLTGSGFGVKAKSGEFLVTSYGNVACYQGKIEVFQQNQKIRVKKEESEDLDENLEFEEELAFESESETESEDFEDEIDFEEENLEYSESSESKKSPKSRNSKRVPGTIILVPGTETKISKNGRFEKTLFNALNKVSSMQDMAQSPAEKENSLKIYE